MTKAPCSADCNGLSSDHSRPRPNHAVSAQNPTTTPSANSYSPQPARASHSKTSFSPFRSKKSSSSSGNNSDSKDQTVWQSQKGSAHRPKSGDNKDTVTKQSALNDYTWTREQDKKNLEIEKEKYRRLEVEGLDHPYDSD